MPTKREGVRVRTPDSSRHTVGAASWDPLVWSVHLFWKGPNVIAATYGRQLRVVNETSPQDLRHNMVLYKSASS